MATLAEYEASVLTLPAWQRGWAAGPALAAREQIARGETFANAIARAAGDARHERQLRAIDQYAAVVGLTGP